jgi:DNA-binding beta-propeller fold protein YncE
MKNALRTLEVCLWTSGCLFTALVIGGSSLGCYTPEVGGLDNEEEVGRQERGRDPGSYWVDDDGSRYNRETGEYEEQDWTYALSYTDVILSPDGLNLLAMVPKPGPNKGWSSSGMVMVVRPLPAGEPRVFPEITDLLRLNFSPEGDYAFALAKGGQKLFTINLRTFKLEATTMLNYAYRVVDVTPDGKYVVLSNLPVTDWDEMIDYGGFDSDCYGAGNGALNLCRFTLVDVESGEVRDRQLGERIRDIDFSSVNSELLLTTSKWVDAQTEYLPETTIHFFDPETTEFTASTSFPNCADEVIIDHTRNRALLSPVRCSPPKHPSQVKPPPPNKDPISVIDLETREFITNLPGFGPVVLAADGDMAIGFTRQQALEDEWNYFEQETPVGLIFVELDTLEYHIINYGDEEPAYTVSPDGRRLYLFDDGHKWVKDNNGTWHMTSSNTGLKQFDLDKRKWKNLTSFSTALDRFVWTANGKSMYYLSDQQLFRLNVASEEVTALPIIGSPDNINLRPQQDYLVLGEGESSIFYLLDRTANYSMTTIDLGGAL